MTSDRQDQRVGDNSTAIQSQRDTIINQGLATDQILQVQAFVSEQIRAGLAIAGDTVERRIATFEGMILDRFSKMDKVHQEAFADPDYQYVLKSAQTSFARSGDQESGEILVDLVAERAKHSKRSRLQLSLDEAVERAERLTSEEFAELALLFLILHTKYLGGLELSQLAALLNKSVGPLLAKVSTGRTSYQYLVAQGCVSSSIGSHDIMTFLKANYPRALMKGFTEQQLNQHLPAEWQGALNGFIRPSPHGGGLLQFGPDTKELLAAAAAEKLPDLGAINNVWALYEGTAMSQEEFVAATKGEFPEVGKLFELWNSTPLRNMQLTSVGIAIGYAHARKVSDIRADIGIWIN